MTGFDLDLHDLANRVALRTDLRRLRTDLALGGESVSRLAGFSNPGAVRTLEKNHSWEVWRVQAWARGLGHVFRMRIADLEVEDDDLTAVVLKATTAFGGLDEDQLHLRIVAHDLIRTRKVMFSRPEFAHRCHVTERAIRDWEQQPETSLLRLYQRYARALGGVLELDLQPVAVAVAS